MTGDRWRQQLKLGYWFMLWAPDLSSGDFGAFPHKQRPSILSAGSEGTGLSRISIKKQESKEEACTETEREMFGRFIDATVAILQQCFYRFNIKGNEPINQSIIND